MSTATLPQLGPPLHVQRHRITHRSNRNVDRQIQDTEILTMAYQAKAQAQQNRRDAQAILAIDGVPDAAIDLACQIIARSNDLTKTLDALIAVEQKESAENRSEATEIEIERRENAAAVSNQKVLRIEARL